jgi:coenzyme F420 hydrogenase subunit beta
MKTAPNISGWEKITHFVQKYDYCCGCGVCAGICPCDALEMRFNEYGEYRPYLSGKCTDCGLCSKVCPFVSGNPDEDQLGKTIFAETSDIKNTPVTGYYLDNFVGHVADPEHRWQGASGGMASWFLKTLIKNNIVDHIICVLPHPDSEQLFKFEIISQADEIIRSAKSVYYPVELSHVLKTVKNKPGRYALIGLPCVIKALRLASLHNTKFKKRIIVYAGLTCGHLKSKGFAEILVRKMEVSSQKKYHLCFRDKVEGMARVNFSIMEGDKKIPASLDAVHLYLTAWVTGVVKLRACNFCDDVFAELSDVSFMDAHLPEYSMITSGTSLVIARSQLAKQIIKNYGIQTNECFLKEIDVEKVIKSQAPVIEIKRDLLRYRLWLDSKAGNPTPRKRVTMKRPSFFYRLMILMDENVRTKSFAALQKQQKSGEPGLDIFMAKIRQSLFIQKGLKKILRLRNLGRAA